MYDRLTAETIRAEYERAAPIIRRGRKPTIGEFIEDFAAECGVPASDLIDESRLLRARHYSEPRHDLMLLIRDSYRLSYPHIGRILGGRDHSTIINGCKEAERRAAK